MSEPRLESSNDVPVDLDEAFVKAREFSGRHARPDLLMFEVGVLWMHKKIADHVKACVDGDADSTSEGIHEMLIGVQLEFDAFHARRSA